MNNIIDFLFRWAYSGLGGEVGGMSYGRLAQDEINSSAVGAEVFLHCFRMVRFRPRPQIIDGKLVCRTHRTKRTNKLGNAQIS